MKLLMKMAGFLSWQRCSTVYPASLAKHPQTWTKEEIGAWLRWCSEEYSIEPIPPEKFDLNGKALCLLSRSDFMERVPRNGDVLYNCLQSLITKHTGSGLLYQQSSANTSSTRDVYQPHSGDQISSSSSISDHMTPAGYLLVPSSSSVSQPSSIPLTTVPCTVQSSVSRTSFVPIKPHPYISIPVRHQQGETTATLVRPSVHLGDQVFHGPSSLLGEQSHGNGHSLDPHRPDRSSDCRLLWEFIYQLLSNKKYSNYVCWEDQEEYVFRIINPTGLAELWGQQKNRTNMTYEKLSRALRYYYRMNIIKKVQGKRLTYRFLQSPLSIQKGQRGAKPHYKLQMDLMSSQSSQQSAQNDPDSSKPGSTAAISGHMTPLREETKNESDTEENDSDTAIPELWRESASSRSSRSSKSNRSTPAYRMLLDEEHQSKEQESASDKLPQTKISEVSPAYSSLNLHQHGAKHSSYVPTFSEGRYLPFVKHEHFYTSPHTMTTESYFQHPRQPLSSLSPMEIKPEQERLDVLDMRPYGRNIRYPENMYRSLSSDFAQSLKVRPFAFRPSQPRSASPRCDVQQEPEDLSTKKETRSEKTSGEESFRPGSSFSPIKLIESVSSGSQNMSDLYTSGQRDRSDIYTSASRDRPDLYTSASRDESESYTLCSREGPGASSFSSRDSSNISSSQDKSDRNIRFSGESRKAKLESSPELDDNF